MDKEGFMTEKRSSSREGGKGTNKTESIFCVESEGASREERDSRLRRKGGSEKEKKSLSGEKRNKR